MSRSAPPVRRLWATLLSVTLAAGMGVIAPTAASAAAPTDGLILSYDFTSGSGTTVADRSGNNRNATLLGDAAYTAGSGVRLGGTNGYVKLPDNVMTGLTAITVTAQVKASGGQRGPMIWALGNTGADGVGNGYLYTNGLAGATYKTSIATGNWTTEQTVGGPATLPQNVWKTITYTLGADNVARIYTDGVQVAEKAGVTVDPGQIGNGTTTANYLGRAVYNADPYFSGEFRSFSVYNRALSAAEVGSLVPGAADTVAADKAALTLGNTSAVTANLTLPTAGGNGSTITWATSDATVVTAAGVVTRSATDRTATLTATLNAGVAPNTATDTKSFTVTVPADDSPQTKADAAAAAVTVPNLGDVRGNLTLPTTGLHGSTIAWASSDTAIVDATGIVERPATGSAAATVTLTATVTVGAASATRVLTATVPALPAPAPYAGYAFSYFTGNSLAGENIFFAASQGNNALRWTELNGGQPKLTSTLGTKGLRDPFLIRSPEGDKFFLIATDLSIGGGTSWGDSQTVGSKYLEVWESTDLVNWSAQRHVKVSPDTAGNTWAPEAYWDDALQSYVVFWASKIYADNDPQHTGNTYNKMLYATTRDFVTFSAPKVWQDFGTSRIDSTVIKDSGTYYRFTKDEGGVTGCSDIIQEKSTSLTAVDDASVPGWSATNPAWTIQDSCIGRDAGTSAVEGPTVFKANDGDTSGSEYYLFVDEYGGRGYIPLGTDNLAAPDWKVPASYQLPASPRHGTVIPVTQAELSKLTNAPDPVKATAAGLVAGYTFGQTSGTTVTDTSGNGYDATLVGGPTSADGSLTLDGVDDHVKLPDNLLAGLDAVTVSSQVWIDPSQAGSYFLWGFGNTAADGVGNGYLFATGDPYRSGVATGNWTTEQGVNSGAAVGRGGWHTLTMTQAGGTQTLYLDGAQVGEKTGVTITPGLIGGGRTTGNAIGRSVYNADRTFKGKVRDFQLYNRALSPAEVGALGGNATTISSVTLDSLKVPAIITADSIVLPVRPGTDLTTLNPTFAVAAGSTVSLGGPTDYRTPKSVTVTSTSGATRTYTVEAHLMRSPVLPGLNADPNIAVFDGVYYLYATTDGFAGWGGKEFFVWKSTDLANWTRSDRPFLTLDGANGNVPWATGNAWAPTITERNGKYYFYFSGENPTYNRKTIGVAVADSPEGPFTAQPTAMITNNESVTTGQAIDPATFKDPVTGRYYLFWGNGSPFYAELSDDMLSIKAGTIKRISGLTDFREGLFVNHRDGLYHLTWSIDDTGSPDYRVGYATATNIDGPWTYRGVILEKSPQLGILATGHHSIIQVPGTDDWYIAYHRFAIPGGDGQHRETTIDRLTFNADGTMARVVPTLESVDPLAYPGTAPAASVSATGADGWSGPGAALTVTGTGTLQYRIGAGAWTTWTGPVPLPAGTSVITYRAQAANGQFSPEQSLTAKVDGDLPTVSGSLNGRMVTVVAADASSGVASTEYRVDSAGWVAYTAPVVVDGAAHVVSFRATDRVGYVSAVGQVSVPAVAGVDPKAVVTVTSAAPLSADGWYRTAIVVTAAVPAGATGTKVQLSVDGGAWRTSPTATTISANGPHSVRTRLLKDNLVVAGSDAELTVKVDRSVPTTTMVRRPSGVGTPRNPVDVTFTATDPVSGVASVEYMVNGGTWTAAGTQPIRFATVGSYAISYRATDRAGNVAASKSTTVSITADVATALVPSAGGKVAAGTPVTFTLRGFHRYDQVTLSYGGSAWSTVTTDVSGAARVTLTVPATTPKGALVVTATGTDPGTAATATLTVR
ncbi:family 43 glycosylhydrolase [Nakamurella deserti]|uniref:family 43 glycosylhydrolase n=1 Tax=Nakamurella deserti TaxID=2164074 RepID=UPI001478A35F|nr:family 43 glycosylhydrolase [Nakamurella deserti]